MVVIVVIVAAIGGKIGLDSVIEALDGLGHERVQFGMQQRTNLLLQSLCDVMSNRFAKGLDEFGTKGPRKVNVGRLQMRRTSFGFEDTRQKAVCFGF